MLADKSVKVKVKIFMNFVNEILNSPCNSLLATFFELNSEVCPEKSVIFFGETSSSPADNKSAVQVAVSPSPFAVPEENVAGERGEESPVGGPKGPTEVSGVCETEAGTEADVEDEDEDVDLVGGVEEVGVSG